MFNIKTDTCVILSEDALEALITLLESHKKEGVNIMIMVGDENKELTFLMNIEE